MTEYLEGTLPPAEGARFEEHLAVCPGCRIYLDQMRQTIRTVGKLAQESISSEAKQDLLQLFRDWKKADET